MNPDINSRICLGVLVFCFAGAVAGAEERVEKPLEIGARTAALLDLQSSGSAAGKLQPLSGEVASRSYRRYLDGFNQPQSEGKEHTALPPKTVNSGTR